MANVICVACKTVGRRGEEFRINSVNSSPGISRIYEIHYMVEAMDFFLLFTDIVTG